MTAPAAGSTGSGLGRGWLLIGVAVVLVVLIGMFGRSEPEQGFAPYSPESTDEQGAKALVELVESFDAEVTVTDVQPPRDADVALALGWVISEEDDDVAAWRRWVREGGTLVLTEWVDGLSPEPGYGLPTGTDDVIERGECDAELLEPVIELAGSAYGWGGWEVPTGASSCFGNGDEAVVVVEEVGDGRIVSVGSIDVFVNANLDAADNAVLATQLLVPEPGTRVAWLEYPATGTEPGSGIFDVMGAGVKLALLQAGLAFVVFAFVRGRRLGAPIAEPFPTQIAGSELVDAVGTLLAQSRDPNRAAAVLRADLLAQLARRFGAPPDRPDVVAEVVAARTGMSTDRLLAALVGQPVVDDGQLARLAEEISSIRQETLHGTRT